MTRFSFFLTVLEIRLKRLYSYIILLRSKWICKT